MAEAGKSIASGAKYYLLRHSAQAQNILPMRTIKPHLEFYNVQIKCFCNRFKIGGAEKYDEYLNDGEVSLHIKHYVLEHKKEIEEVREQIQFLEQILAKGKLNETRRIPEHVKMYVWRRDKGQCVKCSRKENLEFDHIIPASKGGSNTARNIQLLCAKCNGAKSDKI